MRKLTMALLACGAVLAAAACSAEPEERSDDGDNVAVDADDAPETGSDADGGGSGASITACDDAAAIAEVSALLASAEVDVVEDFGGSDLNCSWGNGDELGPAVIISATHMGGGNLITKEDAEAFGQTVIDDPRFDDVNVVAAEVLGCENGEAKGIMGCAVVGYGDGLDISVQVLNGEAVTRDQIVDALWGVAKATFG